MTPLLLALVGTKSPLLILMVYIIPCCDYVWLHGLDFVVVVVLNSEGNIL